MFLFRCSWIGILLIALAFFSSPVQGDSRKGSSSKDDSKRESSSRSKKEKEQEKAKEREKERESKSKSNRRNSEQDSEDTDEFEDGSYDRNPRYRSNTDRGNYSPRFGSNQPQGNSQPQYQPNHQPNYAVPGNQYADPNAGQYYPVQPVQQSIPAPPKFDGGSIVLANPVTNDKPIDYSLNGNRFTIRPGQSQTFSHDRHWVVEFDRGGGLGTAQYGLKAVAYKFKPTIRGWELFESTASTQPPIKAPAPPVDDPSPVASTEIKPVATPTIKPVASQATPGKTPVASPDLSDEQIIRPRNKLPKPPMPNGVAENPANDPK